MAKTKNQSKSKAPRRAPAASESSGASAGADLLSGDKAPWWASAGLEVMRKQGFNALLVLILLAGMGMAFYSYRTDVDKRDHTFISAFEKISKEGSEMRALEHAGMKQAIEQSTRVQERMLDKLNDLIVHVPQPPSPVPTIGPATPRK